jgi:hypothetical protein
MINSSRTRVALLALLLVSQASLLVWFGTVNQGPFVRELAGAGDDPVGETVVVTGTVIDTNPVRVRIDRVPRSESVAVRGVGQQVNVRDHIQVRGRVTGHRTVRANRAIVVPWWGQWYAWSISFLAGLWVLGRVGRQWTFDSKSLSLVLRTRDERAAREED